MKGFVAAQEGHWVNALPPRNVSSTGTVYSDYFKLEDAHHASILVQIGASDGSQGITVLNSTSSTGGGSAIGFNYQAEESAAGDTLGSWSTASASGITGSTAADIMYAIEIDASELSNGKWLTVGLSGGSTTYASVAVLLSGHRFQQELTPTAIS